MQFLQFMKIALNEVKQLLEYNLFIRVENLYKGNSKKGEINNEE